MGFHGSRWVFMVFLDSRLIGHGSKWVLMVFHCSRLGFHCAMSVLIVFHGSRLVFHGSRSVFMVLGFFLHFHDENTLKLYSGPTIQSRLCWPF